MGIHIDLEHVEHVISLGNETMTNFYNKAGYKKVFILEKAMCT